VNFINVEWKDSMANEELSRARMYLEELDVDWALLSSQENVTYVSHYEVPVDFGPMAHLNYGPVLALIDIRKDNSFLLANQYYSGEAKSQTALNEIISFDILEVFEPFKSQDRERNFKQACENLFKQVGLHRGNIKLGSSLFYVGKAKSSFPATR